MKNFLIHSWRHAYAITLVLFSLFPIYLVILSSFNPTGSLRVESFLPTNLSLANYRALFTDPSIPFLTWMQNTLLISAATSIISVTIGSASAFAFSRLKFRGKKVGLQALLLVQMFPAILALSAIYVLMERIDTFAPALGLGSKGGLLKGFVDSIPVELDEAAKVDGASPMQTFWLIFLPLASPVLAVVALLTFIGTFNEFIVARLFLADLESRTVAVGLQQFIGGQFGENWGPFAAGSLIASIPIVVLFLFLQKYIINGLTAGSTKG
jgi:arabinogalactan oligomer/maltooligosaccharide transport system permease protein